MRTVLHHALFVCRHLEAFDERFVPNALGGSIADDGCRMPDGCYSRHGFRRGAVFSSNPHSVVASTDCLIETITWSALKKKTA